MLRFCSSCRRITDERDMHTHDICSVCYSAGITGVEKGRNITEDKQIESFKASAGPAGEVERGPYLPGMAPGQGE